MFRHSFKYYTLRLPQLHLCYCFLLICLSRFILFFLFLFVCHDMLHPVTTTVIVICQIAHFIICHSSKWSVDPVFQKQSFPLVPFSLVRICTLYFLCTIYCLVPCSSTCASYPQMDFQLTVVLHVVKLGEWKRHLSFFSYFQRFCRCTVILFMYCCQGQEDYYNLKLLKKSKHCLLQL